MESLPCAVRAESKRPAKNTDKTQHKEAKQSFRRNPLLFRTKALHNKHMFTD